MKNALLVAAMMLGSVAFAQGADHAAPVAPAAPATASKMSKHDAKKECLKENKELKGAKLAECVKSKAI